MQAVMSACRYTYKLYTRARGKFNVNYSRRRAWDTEIRIMFSMWLEPWHSGESRWIIYNNNTVHFYVRLAELKSCIVAEKHDSAPGQLDLCACAVQHQSGRERVYVCVRKKGDRERDWESDRKRERERKGSQEGCYRRNGGGFADWPPGHEKEMYPGQISRKYLTAHWPNRLPSI